MKSGILDNQASGDIKASTHQGVIKSMRDSKVKDMYRIRAPRKFKIVDQDGIHNLEIQTTRDYRRFRQVMKVENDRIFDYVPSHLKEYNKFIRQNQGPNTESLIPASQRIFDLKKNAIPNMITSKSLSIKNINNAIKGIIRHQDDFVKHTNGTMTDDYLNNHFRELDLNNPSHNPPLNPSFNKNHQYDELYALSEASFLTGNNSQQPSQRDLRTDSILDIKHHTPGKSKLMPSVSRVYRDKSRASHALAKSRHQLEPANNYERSAELYSDEGRLRYYYQRVPEDLVCQQSFNDYYSSIEQSLKALLRKHDTLERESINRLKLTRSYSNTGYLTDDHASRDMMRGLESLNDKIAELKKVKQSTHDYFQIYYKVEKKKRIIESSVHALQVIDEQIEEFNRRMGNKQMLAPVINDIEDGSSAIEHSRSSKNLSSSDYEGSLLRPYNLNMDIGSPKSRKRQIATRQVNILLQRSGIKTH